MTPIDWQLEWLHGRSLGRLTMSIQGHCITEHEDFLDEHRVKPALIIDPLPLAEWLMANWWRLRWEGEASRETRHDWRMSHCLAAASGGVPWPTACFSSDGESIYCQARPTEGQLASLRFLNAVESWVPASAFEGAVDTILAQTLEQVDQDHALHQLWHQLQEERSSWQASAWRRLEARMGYDPDMAPEWLMERLIDMSQKIGMQAVEEVASESLDNPVARIQEMQQELQHSPLRMRHCGKELSQDTGATPAGYDVPWKRAERVARSVRQQLGIGNEPISNQRLSEYLEIPGSVLESQYSTQSWGGGLRDSDGVHFQLSAGRETSRRFSVARLLGDHLDTPESETLLPITKAKTARQKFQRAFAQELLCPIQGLVEWLDTEAPDEEQIENAADFFHVSPMVVEHTLENKLVVSGERTHHSLLTTHP